MSSMFSAFSYLTHPIVLSAAVGAVVYHVTSDSDLSSENENSQASVVNPVIASAVSIAIAYYLLSGDKGFASFPYSMTGMGLN